MQATFTCHSPDVVKIDPVVPSERISLSPVIALVPSAQGRGLAEDQFGRTWVRQTQCKARILASARQLVMEQGYSNVGIRELAERSGVTPPTVYNLVGKRQEVLQKAVCEMQAAKIALAALRSLEEDVNGILMYGEVLWLVLAENPEYSRQAIRAIMSLDEHLASKVKKSSREAIDNWLTRLEHQGKLRRPIDKKTISNVICRNFISAVYAWSGCDMNIQDLREQLAFGSGLVLLGLVTDDEAERIENWLAKVR